MMIIIYILLGLSVLLNLLFLLFDVLPYLVPDFKRKFMERPSKKDDVDDIEQRVVEASISIIKKKRSIMTWNSTNLYLSIKSGFKNNLNSEFKNYNYPR